MKIIDKFKFVCWNIGFIETPINEILQGKSYKIEWMKHSFRDRFFADPFFLDVSDNLIIILAEEYLFTEQKGKIVKLFVDKQTKKLVKRELLIETEYHLSYPFIYNDLIIPEQSKSGKLIAYDLSGAEKKVISNCGFIDGTFLMNGETGWFFASKKQKNQMDINKKLYRYIVKDGQIDLSSEMIIKDDFNASRCGGAFFEVNNQLYRVAQTSTEKIYGESLTIMKIEKNDAYNYIEQPVKTIHSHNEKKFNKGLHTLNVKGNLSVVDGFEMSFHPIKKIYVRLRKRK